MNRYALKFDDGHVEHVDAEGPTEAVAQRAGGAYALLPHTISDLTAINAWQTKSGEPKAVRMADFIDESAPLRQWRAKELA